MKLIRVVQNIIEVIFILCCGFLGVSSLFVHGAMNFETYEEKITLESRNPFPALLETALFLLVLLAVSRLFSIGICDDRDGKSDIPDLNTGIKGESRKIRNGHTVFRNWSLEKARRRSLLVGVIMVILVAVLGLVWIHVNPYPPYSDQKKVWDAAVALAEGKPDEIDAAYFRIYPFQKRMAVVFRPIVRILGTNPAFSVRLVNVVCAVFLAAGILVLCSDTLAGSRSGSEGSRSGSVESEEYSKCNKKTGTPKSDVGGAGVRKSKADEIATEKTAATTWKEEKPAIRFLKNRTVGALLCLLFTPIVIYTCFVYGTLMAAAACVFGFHGILQLNRTGKWRYGLLPLLLFPFANLCYSSTKIAIIAGIITLILPVFIGRKSRADRNSGARSEEPSNGAEELSKGTGELNNGAEELSDGAEEWSNGAEGMDNPPGDEKLPGRQLSESEKSHGTVWFRILLAAGIVILTVAAERGADALFDRASGLSGGDSFPYLQYVYMGISTSEEDGAAGPGSFANQESPWNGSNAAEVNEIYRDKVTGVLQDYLHHRRSLRFFVRKTWYQWLDPWFSSLTMTFSLWMRDVEIPDALRNFMTGRPIRWMQHLLTILMSTMYLMALWNAIAGFHGRWKSKKMLERGGTSHVYSETEEAVIPAKKDISVGWKEAASFLLEIYFIGGFVFQLFWESKARYCFPYFLCLIPLAAGGICSIYSFLEKRIFWKREFSKGNADKSVSLAVKTRNFRKMVLFSRSLKGQKVREP